MNDSIIHVEHSCKVFFNPLEQHYFFAGHAIKYATFVKGKWPRSVVQLLTCCALAQCDQNLFFFGGGGFHALRPSQQLWSFRNGQFTQPHFFSCASLTKVANQYFVYFFSLVADNNPS